MGIIRKRRVFYLSGFDPRGVAAYHRLFAEEAQKQASRTGQSVTVGSRKRISPLSSIWRAQRPPEQGAAETTFEFLHWDDIVREHWHTGYHRLYRIAPTVYWRMLVTTGVFGKVFRVSKWPCVTGLAPGLVLLGMPMLALLTGWGGYVAATDVFPQSVWAASAAAVAGFAAVSGLSLWLERAFALGWLLRTYAFVFNYGLGQIPAMDTRLDQFAQHIARYIETSNDDEIVIVGHSVGANLAVSMLARAVTVNPELWRRYKPVGLLTLGGTLPMLGLMPTARVFREELTALAVSHELDWVDISAFEDAASFPLVNPLTASGIAVGQDAGARPKVVAGDFKTMLTPGNYYRAVWNLFRMHFQYLMATERDLLHDYLSVTTGSLSFRQRFGQQRQP